LAVAKVNGQEQINFQMPILSDYSSLPYAQRGIIVKSPHGLGFLYDYGSGPTASIFGSEPGGTPALLHGGDYSLVTASSPARVGEVILVYATGLGLVDPVVPTGTAAPAAPLSHTTAPVTAKFGSVNAVVQFAGLAPGFAGVYQVNVVVPQVSPGLQKLSISGSVPVALSIQ
jgi:adhesin/invasin